MRGAVLAVAALVTVLALGGCSDEPSEAQGSSSGSASVTLTFADGEAPAPQRLQADVGEEIEIVVKADEAGELHVHTNPEQELQYNSGTTTLMLTVDEPGVVEVESHDLEVTVLQLEVS